MFIAMAWRSLYSYMDWVGRPPCPSCGIFTKTVDMRNARAKGGVNVENVKYLGVDLGVTKLMIGEMDGGGKLLRTQKHPTGPLAQREALALIERSLDEFLENGRPDGNTAAIGLGLVGRVDSSAGVWLEIEPGREDPLPVGKILSERYGLPCFLDNDVRSATKAELLFGRGRDTEDMIYINVGTGIAAGTVTGGRLVTGGHFNAGEVGHTTSGIEFRAPCVCGRPDCVESVASGLGLDRSARILAAQYPGTKLAIPGDGTRVSAADIFALYDDDPLCRALTDNAAQALANLIMNLVRVSDPDTVVLGGGVMSSGFLYPKVLERLNRHTIRYVTRGVVLTELDPAFIGILGACSNAKMGMEHLPGGAK